MCSSDLRFVKFCQRYNIILTHSTTYYPQGNGLAESSNKTLVRALKKTIAENKKNWDSQLKFSLWENRITSKRATGKSPYELVYGRAAVFPVQLALPMARFMQENQEEPDDMIRRINQLVELEETRNQVDQRLIEYQEKMKNVFDQHAKDRNFQVGDLVLRWDVHRAEKGKHAKFDPLWYGPFKIVKLGRNNTFSLENLQGDLLDAPVNGQFLKPYFQF